MMEVTGPTIVVLVVLVAALVLRLRQHEPAAVERLGDRLAAVRAEVAAAESRVAALRAEIAADDETLVPLRARRAELEAELAHHREAVALSEAELAAARTAVARAKAELEETEQALTAQRALRAEAEAAVRDAQQRAAQPPSGSEGEPRAASERVSAQRRGGTGVRRPGSLDLSTLAAPGGPPTTEAPIRTTSGAVRPTDALPDAPPDATSDATTDATSDATSEQEQSS